MEHVYIHNTELLWGTKVHAKYKPTYYLQCHSIKVCQAQIEKQVIRILTIERDFESLDIKKKKIIIKVQLAPEKRSNSLRDEFLLFLILMQNFVWLWLKFWCSHSALFFFIKLHAFQFTIYISFEKKLLQKHTVSGMLHVNS